MTHPGQIAEVVGNNISLSSTASKRRSSLDSANDDSFLLRQHRDENEDGEEQLDLSSHSARPSLFQRLLLALMSRTPLLRSSGAQKTGVYGALPTRDGTLSEDTSGIDRRDSGTGRQENQKGKESALERVESSSSSRRFTPILERSLSRGVDGGSYEGFATSSSKDGGLLRGVQAPDKETEASAVGDEDSDKENDEDPPDNSLLVPPFNSFTYCLYSLSYKYVSRLPLSLLV